MALKPVSDLRREEIAKAALAIFATQGAEGMTLERVAKDIGASKGIILHYFSSKDELIDRVLSDALTILGREYQSALSSAVGSDAWLVKFLSFVVSDELFTEDYARVWLSICASSRTNSPYRRFRKVITRRVRTNLVSALKPRLGNMEARPVAESLMALVDGLWLRRALDPQSLSSDRAKALLLTHLEESFAFSG